MDDSILSTSEQERRLIERASEVLRIEADAIGALTSRIDDDFLRACRMILDCTGRVVVSGIGKSGHIANKIAATLASTGTPAFFVHPAEASHGDLGMITRDDVLIALSNSGSTAELLAIVPLLKRRGARLIAMTGAPGSPLAALADVHLNAAVAREACPLNLAPTASTTAALALGDALAVALLEARGFGPDDFASSHPGGALGRRLLTHVSDVMRTGEALPTVTQDAPMASAILEITRKRMGMTAVLGPDGTVTGIFTDGDLRRLLERDGDIR
ncbi:MAG: KpsF/GutQ family sugar-phosphate isomerase, partial [Quisquiliibacterium sp.]